MSNSSSTFAIVHEPGAVDRAHADISRLLSFRRQRHPAARPETLLGMWIVPGPAVTLTSALGEEHGQGRGPLVTASAGLSGLWTLCWCDQQTSRAALLEALLRVTPAAGDVPGRFVPVFRADESMLRVQVELDRLVELGEAHVLPPVYQNPAAGTLSRVLLRQQQPRGERLA